MSSIQQFLAPVQAFFSNDFARLLLLLVIFAGLYSFVAMDVTAPIRPYNAQNATSVDFFYLSTCPHCRQQVDTNNRLAAEFTQVQWNYHDMSSQAVQDLSAQMMEARNVTPIKATPITIIGQRVFVGFDPVSQPDQMREAIRVALGNTSNTTSTTNSTPFSLRALNLPIIGQLQPEKMDPFSRSVILGTIDGFNPCAVWGVIALICMTMLTGDWKKIGLLVGAFILFCAIMHFVFVGGFASPYFVLGVMRYVMTMMGVCALFIGIYQIKAVWNNHKAQKTPMSVSSTFSALLKMPIIQALLVGLFLMAILFNSLGSICAAAVPTVYNQAMAHDEITGAAYLGYLFIYNLAYMLLDAIMLTAAIVLMSGKLGKRVAMGTQIFCALLLTAFGLMLLFAPALLVA